MSPAAAEGADRVKRARREARRGVDAGGTVAGGLAVGVAGLAAWLLGLAADPDAALFAWVTAWTYVVSLSLGALCLIMIARVTGARWFVVVRRAAEAAAAPLPLLALGVVPLLVGMGRLYPWARPLETLPPPVREAVAAKEAWLDPSFFVGRSVAYLAVWAALAATLWSWSVAEDAGEGRGRRGSPVVLSAVGLPAFAFTLTFASFDWIMSMTPEWYSTLYGVYWFAGGVLGALSVLVLLTVALQRGGFLRSAVAESHYYALGRLLLVFVIFWAYVAYSQGFIVWIADLPHEVEWYLARGERGWGWILGAVAVAKFAVPFAALLAYGPKRNPRVLAWVAGWLLAAHWLDQWWLVEPSRAGSWARPGWEQLAALAAVGGLATAFGAWRLQGRPAAPLGDPHFDDSVRYESR